MRTYSNSIFIKASQAKVFSHMNNLANTGMHMMKDSAAMMGSRLALEQLSDNKTGLNSKFRWYGKTMGLSMDFTVRVTKWIDNEEKVWETIGAARMIILSWYRMYLKLSSKNDGTLVKLGIDYNLPKNLFWRIIGALLAPLYASWCVNNMLTDSKIALEGAQ